MNNYIGHRVVNTLAMVWSPNWSYSGQWFDHRYDIYIYPVFEDLVKAKKNHEAFVGLKDLKSTRAYVTLHLYFLPV